ncbi:hypothetical protein AB0G02_30970, partial [Actinosynnema sp. NPDC023658]
MIESTPVSVDVLALRFDPTARAVLLGIAPRALEPFAELVDDRASGGVAQPFALAQQDAGQGEVAGE